MSGLTTIEWTDATWNPWQGCTKVSLGCDLCYAEALAKRWGKNFVTLRRSSNTTFFAPLRWKKPKRVFTCSISDFFHKQADLWRQEAWEIIKATPQHTYQILTKRPGLMVAWAKEHGWPDHVWAGTSVENQKYAPRLDVLANVPARIRFVSVEPMLGPVNLTPWLFESCRTLSWVIAGGESGPGARPAHPDWLRSIRDQCQQAGVPFFFKQWGHWAHPVGLPFGIIDRRAFISSDGQTLPRTSPINTPGAALVAPFSKKAAGAVLDGREWREFPT